MVSRIILRHIHWTKKKITCAIISIKKSILYPLFIFHTIVWDDRLNEQAVWKCYLRIKVKKKLTTNFIRNTDISFHRDLREKHDLVWINDFLRGSCEMLSTKFQHFYLIFKSPHKYLFPIKNAYFYYYLVIIQPSEYHNEDFSPLR